MSSIDQDITGPLASAARTLRSCIFSPVRVLVWLYRVMNRGYRVNRLVDVDERQLRDIGLSGDGINACSHALLRARRNAAASERASLLLLMGRSGL